MYLFYLFFTLFVYSCGGSSSDPACESEFDCAGICGGSTIIDECGVCGGSGVEEGFCDCEGNVLDECGVCSGSGIDQGFCDCNNNVFDDCGVCGGSTYLSTYNPVGQFVSNSSFVRTCDGIDLNYISNYNCEPGSYDDWGVCVCSNIFPDDCSNDQCTITYICDGYNSPIGDYNGYCCTPLFENWGRYECSVSDSISEFCDCDGNVFDDCGVCGGNGIVEGTCDCDGNTEDCDGVCGGNAIVDECGVCNGDNSSCLGCTNPFAENYDSTATIDDGSCIETSITLYPDFTAIRYVDSQGVIGDSTGANYGACYNQDLYFNGRTTEFDATPTENMLMIPFPNPFDYKNTILYGLASSIDNFNLFVIDDSNTILKLLDSGYKNLGFYQSNWDGSSNGALVNNGYYRIIADFGDYECFQNVYFEDNPNGCTDTNACNYDPYTIIEDQSMCSYTECSICEACNITSNTIHLTATTDDNNKHSLWFNVTDDIYGFQIDLTGVEILSIDDSFIEDYNFTIQYVNGSEFSRILGYNTLNTPIPSGCGSLFKIMYEGSTPQITDIVIGGEFGSQLNINTFDCSN